MQDTKNKIRQFKSFVFTSNPLDCSGCGACIQVCPCAALKMVENKEGFLFPFRDADKCILCGSCDRTCPEVNKRYSNNITKQRFYLATNRMPQKYNNCSTIGLCSMVAEYIISIGGKVYGAYLDEVKWKVRHILIESKTDLDKIKSSKYVQSDTGKTYSDIKSRLKNNEIILYIGTPCQISGLKSFLKHDYINLYTIDLMCHGTFSYKILCSEINYWQNKLDGKVINFKFRSKKLFSWNYGGIVNFDLIDNSRTKKHFEFHGSASPAYYCYAYSKDKINYTLRETCYSCKFRDEGRYGDITIGDAWCMSNKYSYLFTIRNKKNGISLFSCNSEKGETILNGINQYLRLKEISREDFFRQPALLRTNRIIPKLRSDIYEHLNYNNWGSYIENLLKVNFNQQQKRFIYRVKKDYIKNVFKMVVFYDQLRTLYYKFKK